MEQHTTCRPIIGIGGRKFRLQTRLEQPGHKALRSALRQIQQISFSQPEGAQVHERLELLSPGLKVCFCMSFAAWLLMGAG